MWGEKMTLKWNGILHYVSLMERTLDNNNFIKTVIDRSCNNTTLPELFNYVTSIDDYAFDHCTQLALTSLPESLTSIGNDAFSNCHTLTALTFKGTPTTIASTAFYSCTNLTTINVPWAEGAVEGAPWGATNATINYNYTEQ